MLICALARTSLTYVLSTLPAFSAKDSYPEMLRLRTDLVTPPSYLPKACQRWDATIHVRAEPGKSSNAVMGRRTLKAILAATISN